MKKIDPIEASISTDIPAEERNASLDFIQFMETGAFKRAVADEVASNRKTLLQQFTGTRSVVSIITILAMIGAYVSPFDFSKQIRQTVLETLITDDFLAGKVRQLSHAVFTARDVIGDNPKTVINSQCVEEIKKQGKPNWFRKCIEFMATSKPTRMPLRVLNGQTVFVSMLVNQQAHYVHESELCRAAEQLVVVNGEMNRRTINASQDDLAASEFDQIIGEEVPCTVVEHAVQINLKAFDVSLGGELVTFRRTNVVRKIASEDGTIGDYHLIIGSKNYKPASGGSLDRDIRFIELAPKLAEKGFVVSSYHLVANVTYDDLADQELKEQVKLATGN
ncbi:MAG: hypothetical protein GY761_02900 [Hyphomicrobiales bacterium]|nr:hypothetical protein [Hyphomicrobiales bacterium]